MCCDEEEVDEDVLVVVRGWCVLGCWAGLTYASGSLICSPHPAAAHYGCSFKPLRALKVLGFGLPWSIRETIGRS